MSIRLFGIDSEGKFKEYRETAFKVEHQESLLEAWLEKNPDGIVEDGKLLIIGRQVPTNLGGFIDLLGIDRHGNVVVLELKRDRTPRETLAQAFEYASSVEGLDLEQLEAIFCSYSGDEAAKLGQYHREYFGLGIEEAVAFNKDQRIVIVGQNITPEIRQTAIFMRKKGIRVTCLEFSFFQTETGLDLLSSEIVVGKEPGMALPKPKISEAEFMASLDHYGQSVFGRILKFARGKNLAIRWGTKGFSLAINLQEGQVPICYGYPPDCRYGQSIYTALSGAGCILSVGVVAEPEIFANEVANVTLATGLFQPHGRTDLKCFINREFSEAEIASLLSWIEKLTVIYKEAELTDQGKGPEQIFSIKE